MSNFEKFIYLLIAVLAFAFVGLIGHLIIENEQRDQEKIECEEACEPYQSKIIDDECYCMDKKGSYEQAEQ